MPESGGTTTQSGILYQNSIAALNLGRLCDMRQRPASERVVEVRIEAPEFVDDIVVTYADRHCDWIQAKENLIFTGPIWKKLWIDFEKQRWSHKFGPSDRLRLLLGNNINKFQELQKLCRRACGSLDYDEWYARLTSKTQLLLTKIRRLLSLSHQENESIYAFFSHIDIDILTLEQIERDEVLRWLPSSSTSPKTLFRLLRDRCGGQARNRNIFVATSLFNQLKIEHGISIDESIVTGVSAYREVIQRSLELIAVPGTNLSGKIKDLFLWPTLQEIQQEKLRFSNQEDEDPRYLHKIQKGNIDLQLFPYPTLKRAVIVAGAGFGKTALLTAIAHRLSYSIWLPILIPLPDLAYSGETVLEFMRDIIKRRFDLSVLWDYFCDNGMAVVLFDGLDELAPSERHRVMELIKDFSSRYHEVAWLLTVRDAKALSAPIDAKILTIDIFDDDKISCFAEAYRVAGSKINAEQLLSQLRTYPDLLLLARIPLFLSLLLATTESPELIPKKRSDLIEQYLHIILHPDEFKSTGKTNFDSSEVRATAEYIAFMALERDTIGLSERDLDLVLRSINNQNATRHTLILSQVGLIKRTANWSSFTYPIIQEYLAACYLVSHFPNEVIQRFEFASKRPWAQTLQFILEKHKEAYVIINILLKQPDDAFGTILRLIGQCIVNGAQVSTIIKTQVGNRLAELWPTLSYGPREIVGKLLANGFTSPLPNDVRKLLTRGQQWALQSGGNEIVVACKNPDFTKQVLKGLLSQDLEHQHYLYELQPAVDSIALDALKYFIKRIKADRTTKKEIESLAYLVANLSPKQLLQDSYKIIVDDNDLPPVVRLAGYLLGPCPLSEDASILIDERLKAKDNEDAHNILGWSLAIKCLWQSINPVNKWRTYLFDNSLSEKRRDDLLFTLMDSPLEDNDKKAELMILNKSNKLPLNIKHTILLLLAYLGDKISINKVVNILPKLSDDNLFLLVAIIGKSSPNKIISRFIKKLNGISLSSDKKSRIATYLVGSLTWYVTIKNSRYWFGIHRRLSHPSLFECGHLIEKWLSEYNGNLKEYLTLLQAGIEFGLPQASVLLAENINQIVFEKPELFKEFDFDHIFSNALSILNESRETRNLISLDVLKHCVEISTSNTALRAMPMIASLASKEALDALLQLHRNITENKADLEPYIEELAGRLGIRIIWDNGNLVRE